MEDLEFKIGQKVRIKGQHIPIMTISDVTKVALTEDIFLSVVWFTESLDIREAKRLHSDMFVNFD